MAPFAIYLLGVDPPADATDEDLEVFNDFYTDVHLPEVAERRRALRAVRYELVEAVRPPYQGAPRFLAVYEVDEKSAATAGTRVPRTPGPRGVAAAHDALAALVPETRSRSGAEFRLSRADVCRRGSTEVTEPADLQLPSAGDMPASRSRSSNRSTKATCALISLTLAVAADIHSARSTSGNDR